MAIVQGMEGEAASVAEEISSKFARPSGLPAVAKGLDVEGGPVARAVVAEGAGVSKNSGG